MKKKHMMNVSAAVLLTLAVLVAAVVCSTPVVKAKGTLPGVEEIVAEKVRQETPYRILELVPEGGHGHMGLLAEGCEPFFLNDRWNEWIIAAVEDGNDDTVNTKEAREAYMQELLTRLDSVTETGGANSGNKPLYYADYAEEYFLPEGASAADWTKVAFPEPDGSNSYYEQAKLKGSYQPVTEGQSGDYTPRILNFDTAGDTADYAVTFERISITGGGEPKDTLGLGYYVRNAKGQYDYVTHDADQLENNTVYYVVKKYHYSGEQDEENRHYTAKLDPELPYAYTPAKGAFAFVPDDTADALPVEIGAIYVRGGFENNNWFKTKVIDEATKEHYDMKVQVDSLTWDQTAALDESQLLAYDMIYLGQDSFPDGEKMTHTDHVTAEQSNALVSFIFRQMTTAGQFLPTVVDGRILDEIAAAASAPGQEGDAVLHNGLYRLFLLCFQDDYSELPVEELLANTGDAQQWQEFYDKAREKLASTPKYVNGNRYVTNENLTACPLTEVFSESLVAGGFQEIAAMIERENILRGDDDKLSTDISKAVVLQYIINFKNGRNLGKKEKLKILELQPCYSFDLMIDERCDSDGEKSEKRERVQRLLEKAGLELEPDKVTVVGMTTQEFIGKIEDVNTEYDLVYIGMNTGRMNVDASGATVYNDPNMNGLVYTHTGDAFQEKNRIAGLLDTDYVANDRSGYLYSTDVRPGIYDYVYTNGAGEKKLGITPAEIAINGSTDTVGNVNVYRFSGNDLTREKMKELWEFIQSHYAVVVADDFFSQSPEGARVVNETKVDNSSWMYRLMQRAVERKASNVMTVSDLNQSGLFSYFVNMPKLSLELAGDPKKAVVQKGGRYYLQYEFQISSSVETVYQTRYQANLYVDLNSDGKYGSREQLTDYVVRNADGTEVKKDGTGAYILNAGKTYQLERDMSEYLVGVIPWKLEVVQTENRYLRTSISDFCVVGVKEGNGKEVIKMLQIRSSYTTGLQKNNLDLDPEKNAKFKELIEDPKVSNIFDIQITSITTDEYVERFTANGHYLDQFNMLVIGFADMYTEINSEPAVKAILKFIADGKSVLFSHDTTSVFNAKKQSYQQKDGSVSNLGGIQWGYNFNTYLRNIVGMDRYGISYDEKDHQLEELLKKGEIQEVKEKWDGDTFVEYQYIGKDGKKVLATSTKDAAYGAGCFNAGSATSTYAEVQGYTDHLLNNEKWKFGTGQYFSLKPGETYHNADRTYNGDGCYVAGGMEMHVTKVNDGQITSFPYEIPDFFAVAKTHYQYYQLDLESDSDNDGESDVVVWYCLGSVTNSGTETADIYEASPNDVRNNYYIYSKGNVMYTGVGHADGQTDWELKLFVNTIIASYRQAAKPPVVTILNGNSIDSGEKKYEYLLFDEAMQEGTEQTPVEKDLKLYFTFRDPNMVATKKKLSVNYSVGDQKMKFETMRVIGDREILLGENDELISGQVYAITIKDYYQYLDETHPDITVEITSEFDYYGQEARVTGSTTLRTIKEMLFELH